MYKTVRQGENSLQYTILPQTEEVLSNSGLKGKGRDYSPTNQPKRVSRKLIFYYLAVFLFGLLLVFGAILVVLILTGVVPVELPSRLTKNKHESWFGQTSRLIDLEIEEKSQSKKKELSRDMKLMQETTSQVFTTQNPFRTSTVSDNKSTLNTVEITTSASVLAVLNVSTPSYQVSTTKQEWIMPALKRLQSSSTTPTVMTETVKTTTVKTANKMSSLYPMHQRESNNDLMLGHDQINWTYDDDEDDEDYDITKPVSTVAVKTKKPPLIINKLGATRVKPTKQIPVETTTVPSTTITALPTLNRTAQVEDGGKESTEKNKSMLTAKFIEIKGRILDDDDEEYKEPLTDEDDVSEQTGSDDVKMSQTKSSWLQTRWPFVDTSSYFQWTDYSARDNLLLPAILSAALSALLVLAVLCYALRRRQRCKRRIQEIGNLTSDLQAEDNAILLTAENPSEDD